MAEQMDKVIEKLRFQLSIYCNDYVITSYQFAADKLESDGYRVEKAHNYYKIYRV